MKRFIAVIMTVSMLLSLGAFAGTATAASAATVDIQAPETYNPGDVLDIVISFDSIATAFGEGIATVGFEIHYPIDKVTPNVTAASDGEGDELDFTSLITESPAAWEGIGRLDTDLGYYDLAFAEYNAINVVDTENPLVITVPFTVKEDAKVDPICFDVRNIVVYDVDFDDSYEPSDNEVIVDYALQPENKASVPADAIALEVAGYRHEAKNVIYYAFEEITIGDYIRSFIEITNNQQDMNYFAIIIVDENNVVTYADTLIGRPQSDKSAVVIPEGSYIIGVNGNKAEDFEAFKKIAYVGATVTLYNVNLEATGMVATGTDLSDAAFTVSVSSLVVNDDAKLVYDEMDSVIRLYIDKVDIADFKAMFENDITVLDAEGEEVTSGYVKTGMKVDFADGVDIIVMGDCNSDGKVDAKDYIRVKRHILRTMTLEGLEYEAALIVGNAKPSARDYIVIKRYVLKTVKVSDYMPD